jgi:hypothetical protein
MDHRDKKHFYAVRHRILCILLVGSLGPHLRVSGQLHACQLAGGPVGWLAGASNNSNIYIYIYNTRALDYRKPEPKPLYHLLTCCHPLYITKIPHLFISLQLNPHVSLSSFSFSGLVREEAPVVALLPTPLPTGEKALQAPGHQASSSAAPAPARSWRQQQQLRRSRVGTSTE